MEVLLPSVIAIVVRYRVLPEGLARDTTDEKKIHDRDLVTDKEFFEFRPEI